MMGNELMPLNEMKDIYPELYALHLSKYEGREEILERKIPLLNCLWNDVIQFLPMHPKKVFELQVEMGLIPEVPPYKFFEVDTSLLDPSKAVVFFKIAPGEENVTVKWLKDVDPSELEDIPQATIDYYKSLVGTGELPFNYQFIPHVVYMSRLYISEVPIISL
ncbi:MAG: group-specific protein [Candidatus Saccharibacteria bacterium]|nr:group-specific protein [Candidatus Saccharibacteria bacterium]